MKGTERDPRLNWSSLVWFVAVAAEIAMVWSAEGEAAELGAPVVVNVLEAKTHLSRLLEDIESGACTEVVIARRGRHVARLTQLQEPRQRRRLGVAKGAFVPPDCIDAANDSIADWFEQG